METGSAVPCTKETGIAERAAVVLAASCLYSWSNCWHFDLEKGDVLFGANVYASTTSAARIAVDSDVLIDNRQSVERTMFQAHAASNASIEINVQREFWDVVQVDSSSLIQTVRMSDSRRSKSSSLS